MKIFITLFLLLSISYANSYNNLLEKDIKGAIRVAKTNIKNPKYPKKDKLMEHANLGHAYVLSNKLKLAKKEYINSIGLNINLYRRDYTELYKLFPKKKALLDKGWKIIENLTIQVSDLMLDYNILKGTKVCVQGDISPFGTMAELHEKNNYSPSVNLNIDKLSRDIRKNIMQKCSSVSPCSTIVCGIVKDVSFYKGLIVSDIKSSYR